MIQPSEKVSQVAVGDVIEALSVSWWGIPVPGIVVSTSQIREDRTRLVIRRTCHAVTGDKFATLHGQKGVVTVLPDADMPVIDGRPVNVVIGSTALIKRVTPSQLAEAWAGTRVLETSVHRPALDSDIPVGSCVGRSRRAHNARGSRFLTEEARTFDCEYGHIRLMQTCHMTFDKHQYTRVPANRSQRRALSGRVGGGGVTLGEMEIQQLSASGLVHCLEELQMRGNVVNVVWCSRCHRILLTCECGDLRHEDCIRLSCGAV